MSVTVINSALPNPLAFTAPRIFIKQTWTDVWEERADLEHVDTVFAVSEAGLSQCEFKSRYGDLKLPGETEIGYRPPLDIRDWWVMVTMSDPLDHGEKIVFMGIVYNDVRDIRGNQERLNGRQPWVAYGPKKILMNIDISKSYWLDAGKVKQIEWLPAKNIRDARKFLIGNRSAEKKDGTYLHGGTAVFTNLDYLEYTLKYFVRQEDGPQWRIEGAAKAVLGKIKDNSEFGNATTAADVLRKLIRRENGLDYKIYYENAGFVISVFSLLPDDSTFGKSTLPKNPDIVQILQGNQDDMTSVRVVRTRDNMYDKFRLLGKRVVMCATLAGPSAQAGPQSGPANTDELGASWAYALQTEYIAGAGTPAADYDSTEHDEARRRDKFKSVFQQFCAPSTWDHREGALAPKIGLDGAIVDGEPADYQNSVRKTLSWIPLKRDFDYTQDPPVDNRDDKDAEPEIQAPAAYIYNSDIEEESASGYVECDKQGMSVSVPHNNLGVLINATPNHLLSLNHAFAEGSAEADTTDHDPLYDYETLLATIAWETDQRLKIGFDVPEELRVGDGSVKEIQVDDAELWLLAAKTVVGVDAGGNLLDSGADLRILRDDTERLELIAAGEIARYVDERVRSEIERKNFWPWIDFAGQILQVLEAGAIEQIGAPITVIQWHSGEADGRAKTPSMSLRTGYA